MQAGGLFKSKGKKKRVQVPEIFSEEGRDVAGGEENRGKP